MNERIEKALMTVGCQFRHDEEYGQVLENFTLRDAERFAELIVWQCFLIGAKHIQSNDDVSKFERHLKEAFRS